MYGAVGTSQSRAGAILKGHDSLVILYALRFNFPIFNNMAKYEALINGMKLLLQTRLDNLKVLSNSQLMVNHVREIYEARDETMK